ncbi:hypothetical protein HOLleu_42749 [Holothuria leucospilota]|uniref:ZU5 domain-containing protein n=1 Tax=Holothuria leucospilota TaxID=206669 RepID=A0A9Q1BC02_HOLLE|nr:hypothetical protein HOLleu_42749 [Holothuria leucospilota]
MDTDDSTDEDEEVFSRAGGLKCLEATASISKEGGFITIPNTEVELQIQPNSFLRDDEIHLITVKILPRRLFDKPASCFEDHSTVMVEILPNNLKLHRAAKLTLPHCLIFRDPKNRDVQIFHSHHNPDQLPLWEDITTSVQHELSTNVCHIWIENFSWIKYTVGGKQIEGKKLFLYTLGKRYTRNSKFVTAEVGYFPALPGNDLIKLKDADFITSSKGTVSFYLYKRPIANLECYWYFLTKMIKLSTTKNFLFAQDRQPHELSFHQCALQN